MNEVPTILKLVDCTVDLARHRLVRGDSTTTLTTREAELLSYLAEREGRDVERDALLTDVWGYRSSNPTRAVDFTIRRLRTKVEPDPSNPVHIISVRGVGYRFVGAKKPTPEPDVAPSPSAPRAIPEGTLPPPRTRFVGRSLERTALDERFAEHRLVVVIGMGGCGKTRLVSEWAHERREQFPGGVWFCDLTPASALGGVLDAVAAGLSADTDARATVDQTLDRLATVIDGRGRCLIILDNAEHVPLAPAVAAWLDRTLDAHFIVTSRERLGVAGEGTITLKPLPERDGIALFTDRAQSVRAQALTDADQDAIADIVRGLDGLPLAIEIAASRLGTLTPVQVAERLQSRFRLIRATPGTRHERHQSLVAALDWSWELLDSWERQALCAASLFRGGFTLEAAEEVLDAQDDDAPWPLDLLQSLTDKSLVLVESDGDVRYRLLESVRQYADRKLEDLASADAMRSRHAEYFIREGETLADGIEGPGGAEMLDRLVAERGNLMAAWHRAPDPVQRIRAALAVRVVLLMRGPLDGFETFLEEIIALCGDAPPDIAARAHIARARYHQTLRPTDAISDLEHALEVCQTPSIRAMALYTLAEIHTARAQLDDAERLFRESMALHQGAGQRAAMGRGAIGLAYVLSKKGAREAAERTYQRALAVFRRTGDRWGTGLALANLFTLVDNTGDFEMADQYATEAVELLDSVGDRKNCARVLCRYGTRLHWKGKTDAAESAFRRALALEQQIGDRRWEGVVLTELADLLLAHDRLAEAEALLADAHAIAQDIGDPVQQAHVLQVMGVKGILDDTDWEADAHLEDSLALLRQQDDPRHLPATLHALALLRFEQQRLDEVLSFVSEGDREAARHGLFRLRALLALIRVATFVQTGDLTSAEAELDRTNTLLGPYASSLPGLEQVARGWLRHGHGDDEAASTLLESAEATEPTVALLKRSLLDRLAPDDEDWLL